MTDTRWEERAACAGVDRDGRDRFHPATTLDPDSSGNATSARSYEIARIYCRACPVTVDCLKAALAAETSTSRAGIWGGMSPRQRNDLTPDSDLPAAIAAALTPRPYATRTRHQATVQASDRTDFTDAEQRAALLRNLQEGRPLSAGLRATGMGRELARLPTVAAQRDLYAFWMAVADAGAWAET